MIAGLFALIVIFGIVGAWAFLRSGSAKPQDTDALNAADFDIKEHDE